MLTLREMAHALGGEVAGGQVLCPGPGHSARDRSVVVRPDAGSPGGVLVHSHAGDDWQAVKDHVLGRLGISPERQEHPMARGPDRRRDALRTLPEDAERRRCALALWHSASDPTQHGAGTGRSGRRRD